MRVKGLLGAALISLLAQGASAESSSVPTKFSPFDSPDFCSQIITSTCNTTFSYIDGLNSDIRPYVAELVKGSYFRYFKLNFEKQCKFWDAQHFCATENCAVEILSPDQYNWTEVSVKPSELGKINHPQSTGTAGSIETENVDTCEDLDYTHIDDDHQCVYVNLVENPERFTGYGGAQSYDVWRAIYAENCFPNTNPMSQDESGATESCVEKNLFTRIVSGLHASIAVHLSNEYLDAESTEFYPNLQVFMERVGSFNDRLSNIYFNYAILSQALVKLSEIISIQDFITSGYDDISPSVQHQHHLVENDEINTDAKLLEEIIPSLSANTLFNTSTLFDPANVSPNLKDEFRARFKNISAIMDCVGCDRCRMWGKLQTIGYGTALKILFEGDENADKLKFRRIEIVALFNTFDRLSKSIEAINNFKVMYMQHLEQVRLGLAKPGEYEKKEDKGFSFPFLAKGFDKEAMSDAKSTKQGEQTGKEEAPTSRRSPPKFRKLPPKKILEPEKSKLLNPELRSAWDEVQIAMDEVFHAFKFVISSYKDFPIHVFHLGMYYMSIGWEKLIGAPKKYEYHSELFIKDDKADAMVM